MVAGLSWSAISHYYDIGAMSSLLGKLRLLRRVWFCIYRSLILSLEIARLRGADGSRRTHLDPPTPLNLVVIVWWYFIQGSCRVLLGAMHTTSVGVEILILVVGSQVRLKLRSCVNEISSWFRLLPTLDLHFLSMPRPIDPGGRCSKRDVGVAKDTGLQNRYQYSMIRSL